MCEQKVLYSNILRYSHHFGPSKYMFLSVKELTRREAAVNRNGVADQEYASECTNPSVISYWKQLDDCLGYPVYTTVRRLLLEMHIRFGSLYKTTGKSSVYKTWDGDDSRQRCVLQNLTLVPPIFVDLTVAITEENLALITALSVKWTVAIQERSRTR